MCFKHYSRHFIIYLLVLLVLSLLFACKSTQSTVKTPVKRKSKKFVLEHFRNNELKYNWISAKFYASISINGKKQSFTARLRIKKDSVIWLSASPALGIEVARVCITKDSLKFINRLNSTYFDGSFNYINRFILTDIDFDILLAILTGNSFTPISEKIRHADQEDKFRSSIDNEHYMLSTIKKRKLKKTIKGKKVLSRSVHSIWLNPETYKIAKQQIYDQQNRIFKVSYNEFKPAHIYNNSKEENVENENQLFPHKISFSIAGEQPVEVTLNYSKITLGKPQKFPFSIPEKYEKIY